MNQQSRLDSRVGGRYHAETRERSKAEDEMNIHGRIDAAKRARHMKDAEIGTISDSRAAGIQRDILDMIEDINREIRNNARSDFVRMDRHVHRGRSVHREEATWRGYLRLDAVIGRRQTLRHIITRIRTESGNAGTRIILATHVRFGNALSRATVMRNSVSIITRFSWFQNSIPADGPSGIHGKAADGSTVLTRHICRWRRADFAVLIAIIKIGRAHV